MDQNELVYSVKIAHINLCQDDACNEQCINIEHEVDTNYILQVSCNPEP